MRRVAAAGPFWFTVTRAFHVRRPSPSLTWCVTLNSVWSRRTRWWNSVARSSLQTSTLWASYWNLNEAWGEAIRPTLCHRKVRRPITIQPIVPSALAVTCAIYRLHAGLLTATNPPPKWNPAVAFDYYLNQFRLSILLSHIYIYI